jgi:hypothetical protein
MGLVSQDHALFGTSIKENIMFGKLDATMDEIMAAAMAANAHNFIRQLPEGYETKVIISSHFSINLPEIGIVILKGVFAITCAKQFHMCYFFGIYSHLKGKAFV